MVLSDFLTRVKLAREKPWTFAFDRGATIWTALGAACSSPVIFILFRKWRLRTLLAWRREQKIWYKTKRATRRWHVILAASES